MWAVPPWVLPRRYAGPVAWAGAAAGAGAAPAAVSAPMHRSRSCALDRDTVEGSEVVGMAITLPEWGLRRRRWEPVAGWQEAAPRGREGVSSGWIWREGVSCGWIHADFPRDITVDPPAGNTRGEYPHRSASPTTLKVFICASCAPRT